MDEIDITWQAEDGYVGGDRPHHISVDPENYRGMTKDDIENELSIEVQQDFESRVSWTCDVSKYADEILKVLEANPEDDEE
jgi:hypothetical protein